MSEALIGFVFSFLVGVAVLTLLHWLCGGFVHKPFWFKKRGEDV